MSLSARSRIDALRELVDYHDRYWRSLSSSRGSHQEWCDWVSTVWSAWVDHWREDEAFGTMGPSSPVFDPAVVTQGASALSSLRQAARDLGIPVPDLSSFVQRSTTTSGEIMSDLIGRSYRGRSFGFRPGFRPGFQGVPWRRPTRPVRQGGGPYPYPDADLAPVPYPVPVPVVVPAPDGDGDDVHVAPDLPPAKMRKHRPTPATTMSGAEAAAVVESTTPRGPGGPLADLGSLVSPGLDCVDATLELDDVGQLHAVVCVDGQYYEGTIDLADVFLHLASQVAADHARSAATPAPGPLGADQATGPQATGNRQSADGGGAAADGRAPDVKQDPAAVQEVAARTDAVAQVAGDLLVGALVDQHCATVSAGWWHGLTSAASTIASPFVKIHKAVAHTVQEFKGPITAAATAVATVYGGPAAGMAASRLTGPLIDTMAGGPKKEAAVAVIDAAKEVAKTNPTMAKALSDAQRAVVNTAAAYHLTATAGKALSGDAAAKRQIVDLAKAATSGDQAASGAMDFIAKALSTSANNDAQGGDPMPPEVSSGEVVGSAISTLRHEAMEAARSAVEDYGAHFVGFVKSAESPTTKRGHGGSTVTIDAPGMTQAFDSANEADDWFGSLDPRSYLYAAYFSASDPTWPFPLNEALGGPAAQAARRASSHTVSGALGVLPFAAMGAAAAGGYLWWRKHRDAAARARRLSDQDAVLNAAADTAARAAAGDPAAVAQVTQAAVTAAGWYRG